MRKASTSSRLMSSRRGDGTLPGAQGQIASAHAVILRHQHRALHHVIQLAHIARPGMLMQRLQRGADRSR